MFLLGTLVNTLAIAAGALLGRLLSGIPESIRQTVMQGIALAVIVLGVKMSLDTNNILIMIVSIVLGSIIGELMGIDKNLNRLGQWLEKKMGGNRQGTIATGFVTATLVYCIGAMGVLGSLDSGLRNNHDILYTKSMLDGLSAIIFSSTLGIGVIFSAIPVFLYQGTIALLATQINSLVSPAMLEAILAEVTAVGGLMIIAIGINILELRKINVANMLPALVIAAVSVPLVEWLDTFFK
ncbi:MULTISPECIES: DUF554 domain-containing protein [Bacillales]|uniref:DUF554 domain-containing protein n=1 Tax=Brevibacillus aydinogluensis TaxID=927786 RepID=A0AA48RFJ9_9BACL|nr:MULTISPECIES: DUF554 domain-containing protein [Bacillales]MBR8661295.1 DUF554 domain-containing protein [Brevibacillus sp. NL20B1]NNV01088.1 DUF554 domain-containing protein [Brevibacillus sp. MCWH]MDT3416117.1 putative membrane protein YqgA involved in biofilm formation [Brevibacillus aydinogluensis]UFJ62207.1 DUF554 domain-containing protein [Anoxybacillus sediminis]CAJ1000717.1 DUF554 domain-containing protein [Brevibacillus aydinogluensis]